MADEPDLEATYPGLMPLDEMEAYIRAHGHLPRAHEVRGLFARGDFALEKIEELFLYLIELDERLRTLESERASGR